MLSCACKHMYTYVYIYIYIYILMIIMNIVIVIIITSAIINIHTGREPPLAVDGHVHQPELLRDLWHSEQYRRN